MEYENKLILGDMEDIVPQLPNEIFDIIIIDIPYNKKKEFSNDNFKIEEYHHKIEQWINICRNKLKESGSFYVFIDIDSLFFLKSFMDQEFLFKNLIHWIKEGSFYGEKRSYQNCVEYILFYVKSENYIFNQLRERPSKNTFKKWHNLADKKGNVPYEKLPPYHKKRYKKENYEKNPFNIYNGSYKKNVIKCPSVSRGNNIERKFGSHPTQKPEEIINLLIKISSNEGDLVGDFFAGSGTTLVCAKRLRRKYFGCEILPKYYEIAKKKLEHTYQFKNILKTA